MIRLAVVMLIAVIATGCATAPPLVAPEIQFEDRPPLNANASSEIGASMISKGKLYVFEGLELHERITDNGFAREYIIEPSQMRLERTDDDGNKYYVPPYGAYFVNDKTFSRRAVPQDAFLIRRPDGSLAMQGYYDLSVAGKRISPAQPRYTHGKIVDRKQPNFRQELIYGGRIGKQIKVTYREFSSETARPAFSQEAQYDLSTEQTIGFMGVRIEVLSATNTRIDYRVIKSFPDRQ